MNCLEKHLDTMTAQGRIDPAEGEALLRAAEALRAGGMAWAEAQVRAIDDRLETLRAERARVEAVGDAPPGTFPARESAYSETRRGQPTTGRTVSISQRLAGDIRDGDGQFSRGGTPTRNTPEALRAELRKLRGFRAMEKAGRVVILDDPAALQAITPEATAFDKAFITPDRKKVYLVAPNIRPGTAVGVFLHDAGVHGGLREWLGDRFPELVADFRKMVDAEVPAALKAERQVQYLLSRGLMDPRHADEERIAYLVEYVTNLDAAGRRSLPVRLRLFVRKVLAALRAALYASPLGPMLRRYGFELSDRDIAALARAAVARNSRTQNGPDSGGFASAMNTAPMFYSALARAVEGMKQPKAPGGQWAAMIQKAPGVRPEEIDWSGVLEWLRGREGSVSKADVLAFLAGNEVRVEEVSKEIDAKYRQYQLEGGAGYRELLLTLPIPQIESWEVFALDGRHVSWHDTEAAARADAESRGSQFDYEFKGRHNAERGYRSSHWGEPNVLAHVRLNGRVDAEGRRVLFIEEVQSDFGQDTRKSKLQVIREVKADFDGIVERMKRAGVLEVDCD